MKTKILFPIIVFFFFSYRILSQGILDQPYGDISWESYRNMGESDYEARLDELLAKDYRPVDVEILENGSSRLYALVSRKNTDGRKWSVRTKLTDSEFSDRAAEMLKSGYRLVDMESHNLNGQTYYGGIWVENKENYKWMSFRKMTTEAFSDMVETYKDQFIPVDIDAYKIGSTVYYSVIWVENKENINWANRRNIPQATFASHFDEYAGKGYRLYSTESYERNGNQEYATIWVKESNSRKWSSRRDMSGTSYHNWWLRYKDLGYRLEDIEVYYIGKDIRYAGVWLENDDRLQWKYREGVENLVDAYFAKEPTAGMSVAVAVNGEIQFMRGWGFQDISADKEAHANTVYRHASISKALASTIGFRLQAKNKIDISKKTRFYEPRLPVHHTHTLGELLSNRGHVRHYKANDPAAGDGTLFVFPNAYEASKLFSADPLVSDNYLYSTHGYTCFTAAIEKVTGKTYTKIMEDELTNPFGLTTLRCENLGSSVAERSRIYSANGSNFSLLIPLSLSWKFGGGGTESSAYDLVRFGVKLLNGDLLSSKNLTAMTTKPDNAEDYAFGWDVDTESSGEKFFAKAGDQAGARSYILCYPDKKIVIVLLCNTAGENLKPLGRDIGALVLK
ncbi:serine hydrolase [Dyadobacter sp. NIV53]|uniref:serine hydrolase n=1 Tax=Dyadobacter sp. NIV53 TaxID=2861765 RepID=UPI001C879010|nr:serine hydrolase [Dyadobacter sp. NIV53]